MKHKALSIKLSVIFFLAAILGLSTAGTSLKMTSVDMAQASSNQTKNFNEDLNKASNYWAHNHKGSEYFQSGEYEKAIAEYKMSIEIIENSPDEYVRTDVSKEYMDKVNRELKVSSQIFPRYGLVESLEKAGKFEEAIQTVDWLMQNQQMKGKEEFLKQKLEGMKQSLLQKIQQAHKPDDGQSAEIQRTLPN